jgi:hypothetical protein
LKRLVTVLLIAACSPPPVAGGEGGGASGGTAGSTAGGSGGGSAGGSTQTYDAGWQWLPVAGSVCGSGSTAGIAVRAGSPTTLFIFMQGGGACWNTGTCVPSLLQFGPICYYGQNVCLFDGPGGTQPTSSHVTAPDPFPADGGGALPNELAQVDAIRAVDRGAPSNPFRDATFVYVPYCTGDLHSGAAQRVYNYQNVAFGPTYQFTMHFAGATNMDAYLARLKTMYPDVTRIWLTGISAGGFGATFNFDRVARAFPNAEVHLLDDSGPFIEFPRYAEWRDAWNMQLPTGCTGCFDGGLPAIAEHLATVYANRRIGLLTYDQDQIIRYYMFGGAGPDQFLTPPLGGFTTGLAALEGRYDSHANKKYFVVGGTGHVLWNDYGTRLPDGGYTAPHPSRDGGTDLRRFIDGWANGTADFQSTR